MGYVLMNTEPLWLFYDSETDRTGCTVCLSALVCDPNKGLSKEKLKEKLKEKQHPKVAPVTHVCTKTGDVAAFCQLWAVVGRTAVSGSRTDDLSVDESMLYH